MNTPQWHLEDLPDMRADWLDVALLELSTVRWPHVIAAGMAGFIAGALTFWGLT